MRRYRLGSAPCGRVFAHNGAAFAEQQLLGAATKFRDTINTEVVFGGFVFQQILLSFLTLVSTGVLPVSSLYTPIPKVDFAVAVVGTKQIGRAQNWVGRSGSNVLKHDEVPL